VQTELSSGLLVLSQINTRVHRPTKSSEAWASEETLDYLAAQRPEVPKGIRNRQRETWRPLLAIADLAGGGWPGGTRDAAQRLCEVKDEATLGALVLAHIRDAFGDADRITTHDLLAALCERDDGPWAGWWSRDVEDGRIRGPASRLARLLREFRREDGTRIGSRKIRTGETTGQGFLREDFEDAFTRYLEPEKHGTNGTDGTPQVGPTRDVPTVPTVPTFPEPKDATAEAVALAKKELGAEVVSS
jgi:hypothetical protein